MDKLYTWLMITDIALALVTVVLAVLALVVGFFALWGRRELRQIAVQAAQETAQRHVQAFIEKEAPSIFGKAAEQHADKVFEDMKEQLPALTQERKNESSN